MGTRHNGRGISRAFVVIAIFVVVLPLSAMLASALLLALTAPPPDEEMIRFLDEHRPQLEALVRRARGEAVLSGGGTEMSYAEEMRRLSIAAGGVTVTGAEHDRLELSAGTFGGGGRWKSYVYYFNPRLMPPAVIDLHGPDAPDLAHAIMCAPDRRPDLRGLCTQRTSVNDLDVLLRHSAFYDTWEAERPINAHWSIRGIHLKR